MTKYQDLLFCRLLKEAGCPEPTKEYRFSKRRWRVDYAWPEYKLAVEIEGGVWIKGRHTSGSGFMKDMEKYNALTMFGWSLLRYTPKQTSYQKTVNEIFELIEILKSPKSSFLA